jgi:hypothetical protein
MSSNRSSVKGKGADIYLGDDNQAKEVSHPTKLTAGPRRKATFYIPPSLLDRLDDAWLDMRRIDRRVKKSSIVGAALEAALTDYAAKQEKSLLYQAIIGDPSSQDG